MFALYPNIPIVITADIWLGEMPIVFDFQKAWWSYVVLPAPPLTLPLVTASAVQGDGDNLLA